MIFCLNTQFDTRKHGPLRGQSKKLLSGYTEHATIAMVTTLCGFIACNVQCWLDIRWVVKDRR